MTSHPTKLAAYANALKNWHRAQAMNNPLIVQPTRKAYGLDHDDWGAREAEKQALRESQPTN